MASLVYAIILAVLMWCADSAADVKCNGFGLESLLAQHLDEGNIQCNKAWCSGLRMYST